MKPGNPNVPVITIDGPSGTGKGTLAQRIAHSLQWHYLDSGAVYRVLALAAERAGVSSDDVTGLLGLVNNIEMAFVFKEGKWEVELDGEDVTHHLRLEAIGSKASKLSVHPPVRQALLEHQRSFAQEPGLVTDGRDMGTVVFPKASLKIYLEASPEIRAHRRYQQLKDAGKDVILDRIYENMVARDQRDRERVASPTKPAVDAVIIDTSELTREQVQTEVESLIHKSFGV